MPANVTYTTSAAPITAYTAGNITGSRVGPVTTGVISGSQVGRVGGASYVPTTASYVVNNVSTVPATTVNRVSTVPVTTTVVNNVSTVPVPAQ